MAVDYAVIPSPRCMLPQAAWAVRMYDRVLGYGKWGSLVLRNVTGQSTPYLPHGIDLGQFSLGLGEGSGAMAAVPLVAMACAGITDVPTFGEWFG